MKKIKLIILLITGLMLLPSQSTIAFNWADASNGCLQGFSNTALLGVAAFNTTGISGGIAYHLREKEYLEGGVQTGLLMASLLVGGIVGRYFSRTAFGLIVGSNILPGLLSAGYFKIFRDDDKQARISALSAIPIAGPFGAEWAEADWGMPTDEQWGKATCAAITQGLMFKLSHRVGTGRQVAETAEPAIPQPTDTEMTAVGPPDAGGARPRREAWGSDEQPIPRPPPVSTVEYHFIRETNQCCVGDLKLGISLPARHDEAYIIATFKGAYQKKYGTNKHIQVEFLHNESGDKIGMVVTWREELKTRTAAGGQLKAAYKPRSEEWHLIEPS